MECGRRHYIDPIISEQMHSRRYIHFPDLLEALSPSQGTLQTIDITLGPVGALVPPFRQIGSFIEFTQHKILRLSEMFLLGSFPAQQELDRTTRPA